MGSQVLDVQFQKWSAFKYEKRGIYINQAFVDEINIISAQTIGVELELVNENISLSVTALNREVPDSIIPAYKVK